MSAPQVPLPQGVVAEDEKLQAASASSDRASGDEDKAPDVNLSPTKAKESWVRRVNPLRWKGTPPIPEERTPSREHGASFFSTVTFQWMSPLMQVSKTWMIYNAE